MNRPLRDHDLQAPIAVRTLHDELVDRLRSLIVDGTLAPGMKVNEQMLCDQFGVSRTPLREALRSLAGEGLIVQTPRRGAMVAPITRADLEEAFPIVGALEALAGELAAPNFTDADLIAADALQTRLEAAHADGDLAAHRAANEATHALILKVAANPTLERLIRGLDARVSRARRMANLSAERWGQAVTEHREILEAMRARDGAWLGAALKRHLANKLSALRDHLPD
ncbi:MAG: GntR family transcriptional regulator [Pseudomonadota bacterium]